MLEGNVLGVSRFGSNFRLVAQQLSQVFVTLKAVACPYQKEMGRVLHRLKICY